LPVTMYRFDNQTEDFYQNNFILIGLNVNQSYQTYFYEHYCSRKTDKGSYSRSADANNSACSSQHCVRCGTPLDRNFSIWVRKDTVEDCKVCDSNSDIYGAGISM
jgi:hypothetical protein